MQIDNFKVEDWFNEYEKLAKYDMADTCVESLSLNELLNIVGRNSLHQQDETVKVGCSHHCTDNIEKEKYLEEILSKKLNYGDIQGSERLHNAIKSLYSHACYPLELTVTHGAIGANHLVMETLIERGDNVVSIVPTYQQHYSIPKSIGANVDLLFLKEGNNWIPDINELKNKVKNNTKIICMNNPNNPTGAVIPRNILEKIIDIARENNCYILCDEVYRGLEHNGQISKSIVELYEKGISTGSMSKVFSLAGLRLGWIVTPREVMNKIIIHREYNTISVSILDDYFSTLALENKGKIIKRNLGKILEGKKIMSDWIESEPHISWIEPKGGTTCLLKYDLPMISRELCKKLLDDTGVLFLPGETLEMEGYLRAGYCSDISKLKKGLNIFSDWMKNI